MKEGQIMNTIVVWDSLEEAVEHLAVIFDELLDGPDEVICSLDFTEAEALAEVLDAARHTDTAARLMHRWVLTEPDWDADVQHADLIRHWLALSVATSQPQDVAP
jgi:hypothetical protein